MWLSMVRGNGNRVIVSGMKIVLLKNVPELGRPYEVKEVKAGYGRNFILARGLGIIATKTALAQAEIKRDKLERATVEKRERLVKEVAELKQITITLTKRANELGHLFSGIDNNDLVEALRVQTTFDLEPNWVTLKQPIKEIGTHTIPVSHGEIKTSFTLVVEPEINDASVRSH